MALKWLSEQVLRPLSSPRLYTIWQAPFVDQKARPFVTGRTLPSGCRVLDVGCGPGTNTPLFKNTEYFGLDISPSYIATARSMISGTLICADAVEFDYESLGKFELIFMNSLMHHLPTEACRRLLLKLRGQLSPSGSLVVLDLILDETSPIAYLLAKADRGDFPRPERDWRALLDETVHPQSFKRYDVGIGPLPMWKMFMAEAKR